MRWGDIKQETCSVARALSVVGDRWTLLILRDCFHHTYRFEDFQNQLGITRHVLAERLRKLVKHGLLVRVKYQDRPTRYEYRLTERGADIFPVIMSLSAWGDHWMCDSQGKPIEYVHVDSEEAVAPKLICENNGEALVSAKVVARPGVGMQSQLESSADSKLAKKIAKLESARPLQGGVAADVITEIAVEDEAEVISEAEAC